MIFPLIHVRVEMQQNIFSSRNNLFQHEESLITCSFKQEQVKAPLFGMNMLMGAEVEHTPLVVGLQNTLSLWGWPLQFWMLKYRRESRE